MLVNFPEGSINQCWFFVQLFAQLNVNGSRGLEEIRRRKKEEGRSSSQYFKINLDSRSKRKTQVCYIVGTIALVKPEKASKIEDMIIQAAQMGKIVSKVSEEQLKQMLEQLSGTVQETKVKIIRKENQEDNFDEIENEFY